jgi:hypothetical protein
MLKRDIQTNDVTFGTLELPWCGVVCRTLELPWRENATGVSCIPEGTYGLSPVYSRTFGSILAVRDVPDRSLVRVHAGNHTGHTHGCILTGRRVGTLQGRPFIFNSRDALRVVVSNVQALFEGGEECQLEVRYA